MKYHTVILSALALSFIFSCEDEGKEGPSFNDFVFNVRATIAKNAPPKKIDYTLEIIAKDAPLGTVLWTKSIEMSKSKKIIIPDNYEHYTFKASKPGYIPHIQHFLEWELTDGNLSFEFIPESLEGFMMAKSFDNVVTLYFPDDQNRCKLYARFDVAEGYYINHKWTDFVGQSRYAQPVSEGMYIEWFATNNTISLGNTNINMYYNRPFAEAIDFCKGIDLTASNFTKEMADVDLVSSMILDYKSVNGGPFEFIDELHTWQGANNQ